MTHALPPFWYLIAANVIVWLAVLALLYHFVWRRRVTPQRYLRTPEAARFLGLSDRTLEKHRVFGTGPTFFKLGGRVVYSMDDLTKWAARGCSKSTKDAATHRISRTTRRHDVQRKGPTA